MTDETFGLQKVCDIHDFFRPEIDRILRKEIGSVPFGSRRAWEFAMIYRAIAQKGRLHGDAVGLGMGAGSEKLIYALAKHARKTVVTDLYTAEGGWEGVRTLDPKALVMSKAPWPVDPDRIDVLTMDMRELKFPDESFDFCWSTGAIEHIGHDQDFGRHLAEVHRVLRPGGVYAFTTAVVFGLPTLRIPHNYYFNPEHLVDLLHASPLHAEPEFDCRVTDHLFNRPHVERFQDYGFAAGNQLSKPVVSFRRGTLLTANVMVLTKEPGRPKQRPKVTGYDASCRQLRRHADNLTKHLWKDYQLLQTELRGRELVVQPQYFGAAGTVVDVVRAPGAPDKLHATVKSRRVDEFETWHVDLEVPLPPGSSNQIAFTAAEGRIYGISVGKVERRHLDTVLVRAKHAGAGAASSETKAAPVNEPARNSLLDRLRRAIR